VRNERPVNGAEWSDLAERTPGSMAGVA